MRSSQPISDLERAGVIVTLCGFFIALLLSLWLGCLVMIVGLVIGFSGRN